jgi:hemerythrin-like domain-containing protein
METTKNKSQSAPESLGGPRREFLKKGVLLGTLTGLAGLGYSFEGGQAEEIEVTPAEDLMREHGLLNRILLIYDLCRVRLERKQPFPVEPLNQSAAMIRDFIEDYHEKLEEEFLFTRFEKANTLTDLVKVLAGQHAAGRIITDQIIQLTQKGTMPENDDREKLRVLLGEFNYMYRPHEAREDTILFPALRKIVSRNEYYSLGEDFEAREHKLFGQDGFETAVDKVAGFEKQLGIFDLAKFTPPWQH